MLKEGLTMNENEITILRANLLGGMNTYITEVVGDEDIIDEWNGYGVPDGCDEETLMEIAADREEFVDICECFARLLKY
jgi:hypothetical protein